MCEECRDFFTVHQAPSWDKTIAVQSQPIGIESGPIEIRVKAVSPRFNASWSAQEQSRRRVTSLIMDM